MLKLIRRSRGSHRGVRVALVHGAMSMSLAALATADADAAFSSMFIQRYATVETAAGTKSVYRIYAQFSDGADRVVSWGGTPQNPTTIQTMRCAVQLGTAFYQAPLGGNTAPPQLFIDVDPDTQRDTFATIGVTVAQQGSGPKPNFDQTNIVGTFPTFINGNQWTANAFVVNVLAPGTQARADYAPDGDAPLRVLLMQLTVDHSDTVAAIIGTFSWSNSVGTVFNTTNQFVNWQPAAAFGTCCLWNGCANAFQSTCSFWGGAFTNCAACDQCTNPPCLCDIVANDNVDVADLLAVINGWGPCPPSCAINPGSCGPDVHPTGGVGQFKGNCQVNVSDLLEVINRWGPCP